MISLIQDLFISFIESGIRFWNNRFQFHPDEQLEFLKLELEKERSEKSKLLNYILELNSPRVELEQRSEDPKPIQTSQIPWHVRKANLERESRARFERLQEERKSGATVTSKSVEELEEELLKESNG